MGLENCGFQNSLTPQQDPAWGADRMRLRLRKQDRRRSPHLPEFRPCFPRYDLTDDKDKNGS